MLAIGEWYIDKKSTKIFKQNDESQPLNLSPKAVEALIFLSENQHRLVKKEQLQQALWNQEPQDPASQLENIMTNITQTLGNKVITITPNQEYLLELPVFAYQYTPVTPAQMKEKLAQQQLKQLQAQTKTSTALTETHPNQVKPWSLSQKIMGIGVIALLIVGFLLAS